MRDARSVYILLHQLEKISLCGILVLSIISNAYAQDCIETLAGIYGDPDKDETGSAIISTSAGIFLAGTKNDSTLLIRADHSGVIDWVRTIDVINGFEYPTGLLLDTDGMLVIAGTIGQSGTGMGIYVIRFDPVARNIVWAREYQYSQNDYSFSIIQKGNGNYILSAQISFSFQHACVFEINKMDGAIVPAFSKSYSLNGTESLFDIVYHDNFIYGTGRYKDGTSASRFRNTIVKLDPDNGDQIWVRFGHVPNTSNARLYGSDLILDDGHIMSLYSGDPLGASVSNTLMYLQKTDLNGNLLWIKEYNMPGLTDIALELTRVEDGYIILAHMRMEGHYVLFKTNLQGNIDWGKSYSLESRSNPFGIIQSNPLLAVSGNYIFFTGYGEDDSNDKDLVLARIDMEGNAVTSCIQTLEIEIQERDIMNPVFYAGFPVVDQIQYSSATKNPLVSHNELNTECLITPPDTLFEMISFSICAGEIFEGYTMSGVYTDTFVTVKGCDSIRILDLIVSNPEKYLIVAICDDDQFEQYNEPGMYIDTLKGLMGECDTVRYLELTDITGEPTYIDTSICEGQEYLGYTLPGLYIDTLVSIDGCDSIRILNLTVSNPEKYLKASICSGGRFEQYTAPGMYIDTLPGSLEECDTIRYLELTVNSPETTYIDTSICEGQEYLGYTLPGLYIDTLVTIDGCDSIVIINLGEINEFISHEIIHICMGDTYHGHAASGSFIDSFQSVFGCDSIVMLDLVVENPKLNYIIQSICHVSSGGYAFPGIYVDTLESYTGCDSIRILELREDSEYIPNVFSPNGDGINDHFIIFQNSRQASELQYFALFDRFGDMVYETRSWPVQWDGNNRTQTPYQSAVFAYVFIYSCGDNTIIKNGNVTLVR